MSNVYSNAIVKSNNIQIGGMVARAKTNSTYTTTVDITNCWFDGTVIGGESGRYLGGVVATVVRGTCNLENILFTGTIDSSYVLVTDENGDTPAIYIGGIVSETKANSMTLNMKSVVAAGKITGTHNHSLTHGLIGRVRSKINNDNTASATAENATLTLENVFLTRDCYETAYGTGQGTGTKIITPAETDEEGNVITEAVTETITSTVIVTGGVIRTTGDDRLIGYIPQSCFQDAVVETEDETSEETTTTTEKQAISYSLDFTSAWTMRTDGVPIPTALADVVESITLVSDMDAAALAKEIGLDYWENKVGVVNNSLRGAMRLTKADGSRTTVYQVHMGQRYYFNGITMDILDTQEQHPVTTWGDGNVPDKFNTSSTNFLFTFADANGTTKKTLIGGDATNVNMEYMMMAYGENNKTLANVDVFAAYHHGHNTTATYGQTEVSVGSLGLVNVTVKGIANKNWADFLLKNTNNSDQKFDVVLFPYYKVYELTWVLNKGYIDDVGSKAYPYNIGDINQYLIDNSTAYYTYGYDDMTGKTESDSHGTVKITFDGNNTVTVYDSWN